MVVVVPSLLPFALTATLVLQQAPARPAEWSEAIELQKKGDWNGAARRYREILAEKPELGAARVYLGEALLLSGNHDEARRELQAAREKAPEPLLPLLLLVRMDGERGELAQRIPSPAVRGKLIADALLEGETFVPMERPALVLASLGEIDAALRDYRASSEIDPWNVDMHRHMGNVFFKSARNVEAVEAFQRVVALAPDDAGAWGQIGSSSLRLMWWDTAIEALEKATALSGEQPGGLLALGYAYERKPDFDKALSIYRRAAALAPQWAQAPYREGRTLIKLDRLDEAERALKRAVSLDPKMAEAVCFLGSVFLEKRELDAAIKELERAVALNPRYAKAHYYLSQAYLRSGRKDEAREELATYERLVAASGATDPP